VPVSIAWQFSLFATSGKTTTRYVTGVTLLLRRNTSVRRSGGTAADEAGCRAAALEKL
jgi:hypothetical protein